LFPPQPQPTASYAPLPSSPHTLPPLPHHTTPTPPPLQPAYVVRLNDTACSACYLILLVLISPLYHLPAALDARSSSHSYSKQLRSRACATHSFLLSTPTCAATVYRARTHRAFNAAISCCDVVHFRDATRVRWFSILPRWFVHRAVCAAPAYTRTQRLRALAPVRELPKRLPPTPLRAACICCLTAPHDMARSVTL